MKYIVNFSFVKNGHNGSNEFIIVNAESTDEAKQKVYDHFDPTDPGNVNSRNMHVNIHSAYAEIM